MFLSQVREKLCSPYCNSLILKIFNTMLSNGKQPETYEVGLTSASGDKIIYENDSHPMQMDELSLGSFENVLNDVELLIWVSKKHHSNILKTPRTINAEEHNNLLEMICRW